MCSKSDVLTNMSTPATDSRGIPDNFFRTVSNKEFMREYKLGGGFTSTTASSVSSGDCPQLTWSGRRCTDTSEKEKRNKNADLLPQNKFVKVCAPSNL